MTLVVIQTVLVYAHVLHVALDEAFCLFSQRKNNWEQCRKWRTYKRFSIYKGVTCNKRNSRWILWSLNFWCVYIICLLSAYNILILDSFVSFYQYVSANANWMMQGLISCALINYDLSWLQEFIKIVKFKE